MTKPNQFATRRAVLAALASAPFTGAWAQGVVPAGGNLSMVVPFAPGGITDSLARVVASKLGERLNTPVIVVNKAGGGTTIATREVANAAGDGRTLLLTAVPYVTNPLLLANLPYDPKALEPLILAGIATAILFVHPSLPITNVAELVAYARQNPGKLSFASSGNGTIPHLAAELFASMTGTDVIHVPFQGTGPAIANVLGGQVSGIFDSLLSWNHVQAGKLRPIAVANSSRLARAPDLPTFHESGLPEFLAFSWFGFVVPASTPAEVQAKVFSDLRAVLDDKEVLGKFPGYGLETVPAVRTQTDFRGFLERERVKWSKLIRERNLKI